jgi:hypothetical protein
VILHSINFSNEEIHFLEIYFHTSFRDTGFMSVPPYEFLTSAVLLLPTIRIYIGKRWHDLLGFIFSSQIDFYHLLRNENQMKNTICCIRGRARLVLKRSLCSGSVRHCAAIALARSQLYSFKTEASVVMELRTSV